MPTTPPYRYGSLEQKVANRLDTLQADAPLEFDTLREIATELQQLRSELAALQHEHQHFLILE
tara:strand:- start:82 stop:270 length:189 start_codon:yes stop_codon:yes gene_type:complete